MITRKVTVAASGGLHARTAGMFAQAAGRQPVRVMVSAGGRKPVQARSLLAVLSLGATCGTEVTLEAEGDGAAESLDELAELLSRDLDAEPVDG
jgi:phosphocarrier protein